MRPLGVNWKGQGTDRGTRTFWTEFCRAGAACTKLRIISNGLGSLRNRRDMMTNHEIAFEMATSSIRFGAGVTREVGMDLADLGARRALVVTDPRLRRTRPVETVLESLHE